jgi:hypothetical protein
MPRKTVITAYNIRSYQIDGLCWEKNPTNHFFTVKKDGKEREISMKDYLKQQYDVNLRELKQPLLYVNFRDTRIFLPTEMCREASLPENFTSDSRKMRDLQELRHRKAIEFFHKYQKNLNDSKRLIFKIEQTKEKIMA